MAIARMLRLWKRGELELSMAFMPAREQCELKDLCRYRERISKGIGDETRKIKSHMARNRLRLPPGTDNFQTRTSRGRSSRGCRETAASTSSSRYPG